MRGTKAAGIIATGIVLAGGTDAGATTRTVFAGNNPPPHSKVRGGLVRGAVTDSFYRRVETVHVGDRIQWLFRGFHNVAFLPPGMAVPPLFITEPGAPVSGANDATGKPFWFNGLPNFDFSPQAAAPAGPSSFDGRTYVNSGLPMGPGKPKPFTLKFTKTGTYRYFCVVHPGMSALVRVVAKRRRIPSPRDDMVARQREIRRVIIALSKADRRPVRAARTVFVGRTVSGGALNLMFPSTLRIKVGETVNFTMAGQTPYEVHTVTFGPLGVLLGLENTFVGDPPALRLDPKAYYPSDSPPGLPPYDGTNHGDGFLNTGVLANNPATPRLPNAASIRFTKRGTFRYECVIHSRMDGSIIVS